MFNIMFMQQRAERKSASHLKRAIWTVYPRGSNFNSEHELSRADALLANEFQPNSAVRSTVKCLNSAKNRNNSCLQR